jgi:hypothetical protein
VPQFYFLLLLLSLSCSSVSFVSSVVKLLTLTLFSPRLRAAAVLFCFLLALGPVRSSAQQIDWVRQIKNKAVRDVRNYGNSLTGTGKQSYSGTLTAGSTTFTLGSTQWDTFSPADVGKNILISGGCGSNVCDTWSSIAGYSSPTQVTLASPAASTLTFVAEAYWWNPAQDDTTFIQAAINDANATAPTVYLPHGVYVIDSAHAPLTYNPNMKAIVGDGRQSTVIIPQNVNFNSRTIVFNDVNHFLLKGITFRGPGINAVFGGNITFHLVNQSNTEDLRIEDVEVRHACSDAIFVDTCILCSFRNVKTILNAAPGIHLHDPVAVTLQQAYSITNVGPGIWIDSGADVDISGSAAESNGISYWIQNAFDVSLRDSDAEAQVHRAPSAPSSFPSVTVGSGGSIPAGTYFLKYTWQRQFNSSALSLESTPSPESALVTLTTGNQTINFTLPAAPTDAPLVTIANVYLTPTNGASGTEGLEQAVSVSTSSTTAVSLSSFSTPGSAPPTVSLIGHAIVVDGSSHVHIDTDNSRSVPTTDARHLLIVNGSDDVQVDNFRALEGGTTPAFDAQIASGVTNTRLAGDFNGITLSDSGTNTVKLDRGTLGLGTSSPDVNLVVQSTAAAGAPQFGIKNTASGGAEWYLGSTDTASAGGGGLFIINNADSAVAPALAINASRDVGVGTNNPVGLFTVGSSGSAGANQVALVNSAAGGTNWWLGSTDTGNGIGGGKFVVHNSSSPTGAQLTINSANNDVGINQTSPAFALDVTGAINSTTGYLLNSTAPSGQVLRGNGTNFVAAQLAFSDLGSSLACSQMPALTGGVTSTAGSCATTVTAAGSAGQIQFNSSNTLGADAKLFWDNTNKFLGVGPAAPDVNLVVSTSASAGAMQFGINNTAAGGSEWYLGATDNGNGSGGGLFLINNSNGTNSPAFAINASKQVAVGTKNPSSLFQVNSSTSGGANQFELSNAATGGTSWWFGSTDSGNGIGGGKFVIHNSGSPTGSQFTIDSATNNVGIGQTSPGFALDVTGTVNATGGFKSGTSTFAGLAACGAGAEGRTAAVPDSTTSTWGATITGGGTNHVLAYCDGTNWTVAAK